MDPSPVRRNTAAAFPGYHRKRVVDCGLDFEVALIPRQSSTYLTIDRKSPQEANALVRYETLLSIRKGCLSDRKPGSAQVNKMGLQFGIAHQAS
jgi:hypothetical protein